MESPSGRDPRTTRRSRKEDHHRLFQPGLSLHRRPAEPLCGHRSPTGPPLRGDEVQPPDHRPVFVTVSQGQDLEGCKNLYPAQRKEDQNNGRPDPRSQGRPEQTVAVGRAGEEGGEESRLQEVQMPTLMEKK